MLQQLKTSETEDLRCCHFSNVRLKPFREDPSPATSSEGMASLIEGHGDHYVQRVMQWCRGWVRTGRFSSLSSRPIPSNVILQKERPVCISIEGHGDHYVERVMQWCRVNYGVVLLWVMVVSNTGVPMSPGYGGYQTATLPSSYETTSNATTIYYTEAPNYYTEKSECYTATYAAQVYYIDGNKYYTEAPKYFTKAIEHPNLPYYTVTTEVLYQSPIAVLIVQPVRNHSFGVVLLLGVLSLLAGRPLVYRTPPRLVNYGVVLPLVIVYC
ncbi:hypothetical protein DAPPUDRAFT_243427 [Daphnia pulex]|uniref:Uncharacterized protein n=1 Tax=Daphnia pulex TaxID=6669 RepID=E9GIR5_DAPPU|nr:hypothetical protein DAPPUDRAFT_243427 [Daphnia pulex]|eukprot:EFX80709.1 hypothetical protein DAPPUDRAFT_243427 [Daphnia pulex]